MVRLAYWLVVMIMVGVTDRHSADEYDDTEPGNIESGDTQNEQSESSEPSERQTQGEPEAPTQANPAVSEQNGE